MPSRRVQSTLRQNIIALDTQLQKELQAELVATGKDIQKEFKKVTARWKNKPKFTMTTEIGRTRISVTVAPEKFGKANSIWRWVDLGTGRYGAKRAPYLIQPKRGNKRGLLFFRTGYAAKTAPVAKFNKGSGTATGKLISKKSVMHPGIKPRLFTKTIGDKLRPPLIKRIDNAIARAIRRAARR